MKKIILPAMLFITVLLLAWNNKGVKTDHTSTKLFTKNSTQLKIINTTGDRVNAWITLGATKGCLQQVSRLSFITHTTSPLQGSFILGPHDSIEVVAPVGLGFNGNISFNSPPINCRTPAFPNGVNIFECIINNSFQGAGAQETIDISCVAGVNCTIDVRLWGGRRWNAGPALNNVDHFFNRGLKNNSGFVGVYPFGCDTCTGAKSPPPCDSISTDKQKQAICNVQRDAIGAGGIIRVFYSGPRAN